MKKFCLAISISLLSLLNSFPQAGKHFVSLSVGYGIPFENSIYTDNEDPDIDIWMDPGTNIPIALIYEYGLSDLLKAGAKIEYEKVNFDSYYTGESYANRLAIGIHSLASYPRTMFHAEFGGYGNFGILNSDEFDSSVKGIEYGIMIGPAVRTGKINIALHFQPCYGYYFLSGSDQPEDALVMYPRIAAKVSLEL
ncbi:MAG: hypothetical protein PVF73_04100 [Bacteroidales bacterium]|jgi:hypothetical protein